jgi:hypothetical protein
VVIRLFFTWLPNFTAVTALILLVCLYWGLFDALIVANLMVLATGLYLGIGYWVFEQMLAYSLVLLIYFLLCKIPSLKKLPMQMMLAFCSALLYGFIISACEVFIFRINFFWAYYGAGIPFDLMHASGSFLFMLILKKPVELLRKRLG